jgi:hypothetical protein
MFVTMVVTALMVDGLFGTVGLIPGGVRPSRGDIFSSIQLDYKLVLNAIGLAVFSALMYLTMRRAPTASTTSPRSRSARASCSPPMG